MVVRRTFINVVVFFLVSALLIALGITQLVIQQEPGMRLTFEFSDAGGIAPRNDVTMRGVNVGSVSEVSLTDDGVAVEVVLDPGVTVPKFTRATITRRSPIGDLVLELTPGSGEPLPDGATVPAVFTQPPPDAGRTIEVLADVFGSVPSEDLRTVVDELARAIAGRGTDLALLSEYTADLPERILEVKNELRNLIETGPEVTGVFAREADILADDIRHTAVLADILRDRRFDLLELYREGASFTEIAAGLLEEEKPNLSCFLADSAEINETLALARNLANLIATLELNHFFFDGVEQLVQRGLDGRDWFRVQLLPHQEPPAESYTPHPPAPDVFPGAGCYSRYGRGVGPGRQDHKVLILRGSRVVKTD
jgi:phospholipid/cholesterol/gamma-HCH transport system substrate-binding protein